MSLSCSKHSVNELVDFLLSVSERTVVSVRVSLLLESLSGRVKLEGPQEVVGFFESGSSSGDLVDEVFNADESL